MADSTPNPRTGVLTGVRRRAELLAALAQVFRERGYEGATLTELAAATGLGKASLYHHFPGGKAEMADALIRDAVAQARARAFAHLQGPEPAAQRLQRFVSGFGDYLQAANGPCLLGVLAMGSARQVHGELLAAQFGEWRDALAALFEEAGQKPKRAGRSAAEVLDTLYGAQMTAALLDDPKHFGRSLKRLARRLDKTLG
ncbi:MAG: TetR/AcrR family transcriptional regulator [Gammaproteobacteria bacterium]|nr:TetR/AcrR family transcriptional regulator [Gammaproteobacteria bacterium]